MDHTHVPIHPTPPTHLLCPLFIHTPRPGNVLYSHTCTLSWLFAYNNYYYTVVNSLSVSPRYTQFTVQKYIHHLTPPLPTHTHTHNRVCLPLCYNGSLPSQPDTSGRSCKYRSLHLSSVLSCTVRGPRPYGSISNGQLARSNNWNTVSRQLEREGIGDSKIELPCWFIELSWR